MMIVMKPDAGEEEIARVIERVRATGCSARPQEESEKVEGIAV